MIPDTNSLTQGRQILEEHDLILIPVNDLLDEKFFIPAYQRGYRWTDTHVEQLLNDLWDFHQDSPSVLRGEEKPFYCLQPIAVKKKDINGISHWEVIDGQQRLTTILIMLYYFNQTAFKIPNPLFSLSYETREDSETFLKNIEDETLAAKNIDYYHIHLAYKKVCEWFDARQIISRSIRSDFYSVLVNTVKVIWYKVEQEGKQVGNSASIDVFTRLNIGKIPLTNAELIKALFLQKSNFDDSKVNLKQLQIASEWDIIEKQLQDDAFWFLYMIPKIS
ncbi:DUF262 domain-containing protein [Chitinophaga oryzae]|uniref:DUF262 domain-containing protein n=1 Tax=Chitinophaga oryzae TaxID=2725414 RepID=A0AAE6ZMV3_9BACT|nr:DUF262 domain-containing protein [Chitinophaga oryzae]QJB35921.1 DUF262 domain-containing protein [Chitinophaga oryzae]